MHITDILPTMAAVANITVTDDTIDGINQWNTISISEPTKRREIFYNIETALSISALAVDGWKIVNGSENLDYAGWFGSSGRHVNTTFEGYLSTVLDSIAAKNLPELDSEVIKKLMKKSATECNRNSPVTNCNPKLAPCLFNIIDDPCEMNNMAEAHPEKLVELINELNRHFQLMVPSLRKSSDPMSDPKYHNNTWSWWRADDESDENVDESNDVQTLILYILVVILLILLFSLLLRKKHSHIKRQKTQNGSK